MPAVAVLEPETSPKVSITHDRDLLMSSTKRIVGRLEVVEQDQAGLC